MAHGGHAVHICNHGAVGIFKAQFRQGTAVIPGTQGGDTLGPGPTGQGDQGDGTFAHGDGVHGVAYMDHIGRAASFRAVGVAQIQAHVFGHGDTAQARRITTAKITVHIRHGQARVRQGADGDLGMELGNCLFDRLAGGMFVDPRNIGLACSAHGFSSPNVIVNMILAARELFRPGS